jgi:hypothetical protein
VLTTEYGGSSEGAEPRRMEADVHAGLWAGFFTGQAGTPFLWWHEFVHSLGHYHHYKGLSRFLGDVDPRGKKFGAQTTPVLGQSGRRDPRLGCRLYGSSQELYGWVHDRASMLEYPEKGKAPVFSGHKLLLPKMRDGDYTVSFFDTVTGERVHATPLKVAGGQTTLPLPRFAVDTAFKVRRREP